MEKNNIAVMLDKVAQMDLNTKTKIKMIDAVLKEYDIFSENKDLLNSTNIKDFLFSMKLQGTNKSNVPLYAKMLLAYKTGDFESEYDKFEPSKKSVERLLKMSSLMVSSENSQPNNDSCRSQSLGRC